MEDFELSAVDQRVLGSLLEKQRTVPASYPFTLNGLKTACNQTSSRDPVTDLSDETLLECLRSLKDRELVRYVWAGKGSRTLKYHQLLSDRLQLDDAELALITVLLLRGPQAPGQLKTRTERLHPFPDREAVEERLTGLAQRGLVTELERRPGQQDPRWVHTLGPVEAGQPAGAAPEPAADLNVVLAEGADARDARVRTFYDTVAENYHDQFHDELEHKPFDTWLLTRVRERVAGGPLLDIGCATGHITQFLARDGADIEGLDLSMEMVNTARRHYPDLRFTVGSMFNLLKPPAAQGWAAITCWYGMVHLAESELQQAFSSFARVLAPGGQVAVALHVGSEVRHLDQFLEHPVDIDFVLQSADTVGAAATQAGLRVDEWYLRGSYPDEVQTERFYLLATLP